MVKRFGNKIMLHNSLKIVKPSDVKSKKVKLNYHNIELDVEKINKGLLKGDNSWNNVLDKMYCNNEELVYIGKLYDKEGWNVLVSHDNYQTTTIQILPKQ